MRLLMLPFFVLILPVIVWAQGTNVEGVVRDTTGALLVGAEVDLRSPAYSAKTITSHDGTFHFENVAASSGTITVIARGMKQMQQQWHASPGKSVQLFIVLVPASINQYVLVTAARTAVPIGQTAISDIELTSGELQAIPALTLDDALRQVPGFSLFRRNGSRTANPTTMGISLRGLGANGASRVLVLEDGVPLNDPFGSWVYWDRVPDASVSSVEVAQEGASSLYGSEALGGVIQFLTRRAEPGGISLETSYGNQDTQDISLSAGSKLGNWQSVFSGEAFHTDGYFPIPKSEQGSVDTSADSRHGTADLTIGRKIGAHNNVFVRGSYFDDSRDNGTRGQTNGIRLAEGILGANLNLGSAGTLELRSYAEFETYHQSSYSVALNQNSESLTDLQAVPAQGVGESAVWSRAMGKRQTLVAGFDEHEAIGHSNEQIFSPTSGNNTKDTFSGGHQQTTGIFAEDLIQIAPTWTLGVSARFDNWRNLNGLLITESIDPSGPSTDTFFPNRSYRAFSPRASVVHTINTHISWSSSVYRAFRAPSLNELYRSFRQANSLTEANTNLAAERLTGGEIGVAAQWLNNRLRVRGAYFFNEIVNPISSLSCQVIPTPSICPVSPPNTLTFVRANLGRTSAPGCEVDWFIQITSRFQLSGGYQFVDATIISAPTQPSLVNTWVAQVPHNVFAFQADYTRPSFVSFSIDGRFVGTQLDTNRLPMSSFFVLDAMASRNLTHGVEAFAAVENLFNEQYVSTAATSLSPPQIGLPIAARAGIRFDFPAKR